MCDCFAFFTQQHHSFVLFNRLCDSKESYIAFPDFKWWLIQNVHTNKKQIYAINQLMQYSAIQFENSNGNDRNSNKQWISSRSAIVIFICIFQSKLHWVYLIWTCIAFYCKHCEMTSIRKKNKSLYLFMYFSSILFVFFFHVKPKPKKKRKENKI